MKLSIIVPVYKVRRHLQNCIESILQQTYTDYELILVDDGSPDNCGAICDRYAQECDKVKVIHKKNGGLSSARNAGLAVAQGEYITFVDGDDTIASGTYYYNMRILQSNPDVDLLEFPVTVDYDSPQSKIVSFPSEKVSDNEKIFVDWIKRKGYEHCYSWNKIYRADLFCFVRFPEGELFEDTYITPILYESCNNVFYSDAGFYYYHKHKGSISNSYSFKSIFFRYRNFVNLYKKAKNEYKLEEESRDLLFKCLDCLTDLCRCSDGTKKERENAIGMIKDERLPISILYKMEIPLRSKIKYTIFSLSNAKIHSMAYSIFRKKLC
ncbi:MAG: glycosyltransferase [Bacteroidaceae bacterium]|nr:glycosyltransferase [Bacteroidaceae bacterium]